MSDRFFLFKGVSVYKGFVGFNNKVNNVELLVLWQLLLDIVYVMYCINNVVIIVMYCFDNVIIIVVIEFELFVMLVVIGYIFGWLLCCKI